jgi:hypothetical protein
MDSRDLISGLDGNLEPLRLLALRLGAMDAHATDDGVAISRRPFGVSAYALRLYVPLSESTISRYEQLHRFSIPPYYRQILRQLNGAHVFQMGLFGIPPSMANDPPLLNRSGSAPYDLATANRYWKNEYQVPLDWFHFGGGPFSHEERVGYFFDSEGSIVSSRKSGEPAGQWATFHTFLADELSRSEADYPRFEAFMARANLTANRPWWRLYRWLRGV